MLLPCAVAIIPIMHVRTAQPAHITAYYSTGCMYWLAGPCLALAAVGTVSIAMHAGTSQTHRAHSEAAVTEVHGALQLQQVLHMQAPARAQARALQACRPHWPTELWATPTNSTHITGLKTTKQSHENLSAQGERHGAGFSTSTRPLAHPNLYGTRHNTEQPAATQPQQAAEHLQAGSLATEITNQHQQAWSGENLRSPGAAPAG